jgi:hypothetical protein
VVDTLKKVSFLVLGNRQKRIVDMTVSVRLAVFNLADAAKSIQGFISFCAESYSCHNFPSL